MKSRILDTDRVSSRLVPVLLGAIWTVSGALMAFNPPPTDLRRAASLPFVGWVVLAGGIGLAVKGLCARAAESSGESPRHSSGRETSSQRKVVGFVVGILVGVVGGAATMWWGVSSGLLSLVGLGLSAFAMSVLAIPYGLDVVKSLSGRKR